MSKHIDVFALPTSYKNVDKTMKAMITIFTVRLKEDYGFDEEESRAAMFCTKFVFGLRNTQVRPSPVHGRGVFATRKLVAGQLITFYPADFYIKSETPLNERMKGPENLYFKVVKSVEMHSLPHAEAVPILYSEYQITVDQYVDVVAYPHNHSDPCYMGHMINDGATCIDTEESKAAYRASSDKKMNCFIVILQNVHSGVFATRDIEKGEELFLRYGENYWIHYQ